MLMWGSAWDLQGLRKYNDASRQAHGFFFVKPILSGDDFSSKNPTLDFHENKEKTKQKSTSTVLQYYSPLVWSHHPESVPSKLTISPGNMIRPGSKGSKKAGAVEENLVITS